MTVGKPTWNRYRKTYLTLSAVVEAEPQPDRSAAVALRPPSADEQTYVPTERDPVDDELLRELLPTILEQYAPATETETELRAMWGDR